MTDVETKLVQLPLARIRRIMKSDDDVTIIANDATVAVARATELFLQHLVDKAYEEAAARKHKHIQYDDCARAVRRHDEFEFLSDIIPEKVPVKKAIENKKAIEATLKTSSSSAAAAQATQDPVPDLDDQS